MTDSGIEFPLSLRPVVRSREGGDSSRGQLPYHPAIWIVDRRDRKVMDVAPDPNDLRAGRTRMDPVELVSRASAIIAWLHDLEVHVSGWIESLESGSELVAKPLIRVLDEGRKAEVGVSFCSPSAEEFDRITATFDMMAQEHLLNGRLDALRGQVFRRHEAALTILRSLQAAVRGWREAESLAPSRDGGRTDISDESLEHE